MSERNRRPLCSVFSDEEIRDLRKIPGLLKILIAIFLAILAGIFMPFQTVSELSKNVGSLLAVQQERQRGYLRDRLTDGERLKKFEKKLYWIDRNQQEARDAIKDLKKVLSASKSKISEIVYPRYGRLRPVDIPSSP